MKLPHLLYALIAITVISSCKKEAVSPASSLGGPVATGQPISMGLPTATSVDFYTVADWDSIFDYDLDIKVNGILIDNLSSYVCDTSSYRNYYVWGDISAANSAPNELFLVSNFDVNDTVRVEYIGADNKVALAFTLTYLLYIDPDPQIWQHDFYSDSTSIHYNKISFTDCSRAPKDWILFVEN